MSQFYIETEYICQKLICICKRILQQDKKLQYYDHIWLIWKWPKYFTVPFDVCSGWKGKTWKLIRFVDLDYHPNVSELISTAAEQEMQEGKKGICLEENTFLSVLNWKWEHFAQREFQHRVMIIWPIRYKLYYSKVGVKDHPL